MYKRMGLAGSRRGTDRPLQNVLISLLSSFQICMGQGQTVQAAAVKEQRRSGDLFMRQKAFSAPVTDGPEDEEHVMHVLQNYLCWV